MRRETGRRSPRTPAAKRTLFLLAGASAVLTMLAVEVMLQLIEFPYDPEILLRPHFVSAREGHLITNPLYTRFGTAFLREIPEHKAPEVSRIAILGGSSVTMLGGTKPLKEMLEREFGREVEILNFGLCGCGTDRALVSARQALQLGVDAVVLYSGHNEFISESNRDSYLQPGWLHRNSRVLQLAIGAAWVSEPGKLYRDAEKQAVYERFEANLRELAGMHREAGIPLVWSTVASNLRSPPFVYEDELYEHVDLPPEPLIEHRRGEELFAAGRFPEAKASWERSISSSPRPQRATPRNNEILRRVASELSVALADVEARVVEAAEHGIPGSDLFKDHCHLNERGQRIMMESLAETLARVLQTGGHGSAGGTSPAPAALMSH